MDTAINGFHHVKLPVADLARSRDWYARVLGLQTHIEFAEGGVLMGVAMRDADGSIDLALRHDPPRAAALAGFDPLARGIPHTFLVTRGPVRGLQITAPAGFEDFIAEAGRPAQRPGLPEPTEPDIPRLVAAAQRYGSQILGPPPAPPSR